MNVKKALRSAMIGAALVPCVAALCAALCTPEKTTARAEANVYGAYSYFEFDEAVEKAAGQKATLTLDDVAQAGVYEISLKFSDDTDIAARAQSGLVNDAYQNLKSFNPDVGAYTDDDGYSSCVLNAYLDEGENTLSFYMSDAAKIEGVRTKLVTRVDAVAFTSTAGVSTVISNMFYGIRLVQAQQAPKKTATAELVIEEDGWYDISYFGAAANQGEIYFTLTDELGQRIDMCSVNLTWTMTKKIHEGIARGSSSDIRCMFTNNSYVIDGENPKDTLDNPYVRLFAGTYKVVAEAKKFRPVGDNCQVYYGGAAFATKVDVTEECEHDYKQTSVVAATCDTAEATTYACSKCGDTFTKKTGDALGHDFRAVGEVAPDGSAYLECLRKSDCGAIGYYAPDCGAGIAVTDDDTVSTFDVTVADAGVYKAYFEFDGLDGTHRAGLRNTAHPTVTSFGDIYDNVDYNGCNAFGYNVYLDAGANTLALYLKADTTVKSVRIEKERSVAALAAASGVGSNNYDPGYILSNLLVQGDRNPSTIETTLTVAASGTYELSYFAGSANDGDLSVTLVRDGKTLVMKSSGLGAETAAWEGSGVAVSHACALFTDNLYVFDATKDAVTDVRTVELEAGVYKVKIEGDPHDGRKQVWFGGGLFASEADGACDHDFVKIAELAPNCDRDGYEHYRCSDCGYYYELALVAQHSYKNEVNTGFVTCSVCGMMETVSAPVKISDAAQYGLYHDFDVTVDKSGVYRFWFDYDYAYTGTATNPRTAALINKTIAGDNYYASGHSSGYVDDVMQSWNYVGDDSSIEYGYKTDEAGGYNEHYFDMYLQSGNNTVRWLIAGTYDITVRGMRIKKLAEVEAYASFKHVAKDWTATFMNGGGNGGDDKIALRFNVIQGNGQAQHNATSKVTISEAGYYDLSYFASTPHGGHEISVTLTNGLQTIAMSSKELVNSPESKMFGGAYGNMLYSENLYDASNKRSVYLTAGEWTVTVADTVNNGGLMLFFGGAVYFTREGDCEHSFIDGERTEPTCDDKGLVKHVCTKCGAVTAEEIEPAGHSYKHSANTGSLTCDKCGVTEVVFAQAPATNKSAGVATNTFKVTAAAAGVYEVYLDYTYVKQSEASKQDVGALINKTLYPNYYQTTAQMNNMKGFIQSYDYLTNDASIALGYDTTSATGYNPNYFNVYLQAGENELVLHSNYASNAEYTVTIRGAMLKLVRSAEVYLATDHDGRIHTANWMGSNLGFNVNLISNSNNGVRKEGIATIELSGGKYDISYLASAHRGHTDNELKITLTKGDTEIVLTSNKIFADERSQCGDGSGKMLLSDNLYTSGGEHLVDLEAGTWTVSVYCTNITAYRGLLFGGLFFTAVQ